MESKNDTNSVINQVRILCEQMPIRKNIVCLLHYGSVKQKEDFNDNSDLDFHIVLKEINTQSLQELKNIFSFSEKIDISIHALNEITYKNKVIFQNGSQGLYFIHVLSSSELLVGKNIYIKLISELNPSQVNKSLIEKMRYYIWLLRRNYIFNNNVKVYKKYFLRIIKDILILEKVIDYSNIATLNNRQVLYLFLEKYKNELTPTELNLISQLSVLDAVQHPEIEMYLMFFSDKINKILWETC